MGTLRISSYQTSPATTFTVEGDVVETQGPGAGAGFGRWRVRFYIRAKVGPGGSTASFSGWPGSQVLQVSRISSWETVLSYSANPFMPSGLPDGTQRWVRGPVDVWVNANSQGYWNATDTTLNIQMLLDYNNGGVNVGVSGSVPLPRITQIPGVPTGLTAVRASDTQVNLSWTRNGFAATQIHVDQSVNGGAWARIATLSNVGSASVVAAANRKTIYRVRAANTAGESAWSASSAPVYTTPAAPASVAAVRSGSNVVVSWQNRAAYGEYQTVIEHGVVDGGITWDGTTTVVSAGVTQWTDVAPESGDVHVYRVRHRPISPTSLVSGWVQSNSVQLLTAPNAPTLSNLPTRTTTDAPLTVSWTHNPVDTTPQTAYELSVSTNGGSSWSSTGKVTSGTAAVLITAGTYAADDAVTFRVRTWGAATSGGSEGTGASEWSNLDTVTYKTRSVVEITSPVDASTVDSASVTVAFSFTQAESGAFVSALVELLQASVVLESVPVTATSGIPLTTHLQDGTNYQLRVRATDSWGLQSNTDTITFSVDYAEPVAPEVDAVYLDDTGMVRLTIRDDIADPAPARVTITRTIDGVAETVGDVLFTGAPIAVLDTTPTINGENLYEVISYTAAGASSPPVQVVVTAAETKWAYLSAGVGFSQFVRFYSHLRESSSPTRDATLIRPAGRRRPIGLFGEISTLDINVSAMIRANDGSTVFDIERFLIEATRVCYRSPNGRRMFGVVRGDIADNDGITAQLSLTVSEAS